MPSEPDYLPHWGMDHNIDFGFHHYLLDPVQLEVPLHFVNHESRRVALHWMHHHCIEIWSYDGRVLFSRWFDRDRDTLYIPESSRDQFLAEPLERPFEPDLLDKTISMTCNEFTRLALPITVLHTDPTMIEEIIRISRVDTIFLLIGQQPNWNDLPLVDGNVLRRFELEKIPRVKALVWNLSIETLELDSGTADINEDVQIFLRKYGESVTSVLIDEKIKRFKMQPTYLTLQTGI